MSKRQPMNVRYRFALPVHPLSLPELYLHNPISWIQWIYCFAEYTTEVSHADVELQDGMFFVNDPQEMNNLWDQGFFGKATFSRSEASWYDRTMKRLGIGEFKKLTMEEVTSIRREERKKFKKERAALEKKQQELKKQGVVDPFIEERLKLKELRDKDMDVTLERVTYVRDEDDALLCNGELKMIEQLQLQPVEVLFLKFATQSISVHHKGIELDVDSLLDQVWPNRLNDDAFILNYIAYHHYRSLGWCVRSGIKFGTDLMLYKRGPPFQHAEFALLVLPNYKDEAKNRQVAKDFTWLTGLSRVIGGVRKTLMLVYVHVPLQEELDQCESFDEMIKLYQVDEVLYRRWVPNRNRD